MYNLRKILACSLAIGATLSAWVAYAAETPQTTQPAATTQPQPTNQTPPAEQAKTATPTSPHRGLNPWVDCGIGAMLFPDTHWAAATSNIIWDYGTTAVTSATTSKQTCESTRAQMMAALFINSTYENLIEETATGQGEHLTTVLNIFGCNSAHHASAIQEIRSAMGQAVSVPNYIAQTHNEKAANYYSIVEGAINRNCAV